jgi:hypothetical protein
MYGRISSDLRPEDVRGHTPEHGIVQAPEELENPVAWRWCEDIGESSPSDPITEIQDHRLSCGDGGAA